MNELTIELDSVSLPQDFLTLLRQQFEDGGIWFGRFAIGEITAVPGMVYFLWHETGEAPVSMLFRREIFATRDEADEAVRDFLSKWNRRLG